MESNLCGCACHDLGKNVVILNSKKWNPLCALRENIRLLALTREELDVIRTEVVELRKSYANYNLLLDQLEKIVCPACFKPVKGEWSFLEGGVFCTTCVQEMTLRDEVGS
jgi:hypothetical protein